MKQHAETQKEGPAARIIVALDVDNEAEAYQLVRLLSPPVRYFKVGMRLFTACGPRILKTLKKMGVKIFLDLKFHDIPHTVASTAQVVTAYGVDMFNIHLSGGREMICSTVEAVRETAAKQGLTPPLIIGVTVLTSFDEKALFEEAGIKNKLPRHVVHLASLGAENGMDGVVASPREAEAIRDKCGENFLIVTPGIRPLWSVKDDQQRVLAPAQALKAGADYLVIGRPIIRHSSPKEAVKKILAEISK
ncbi:MAG: orotidine-5'-phosphate decarboxylase [Dethiobacteria bacterium]